MSDQKANEHYEGKNWIGTGISWGVFMYVVMVLIYPYFAGEIITMKNMMIGVPIYLIGGLCFGYTTKYAIKIMT